MKPLEIITLVTALVGASCGICGTVLGIINTWHQLSRNRVRLRVVPKIAYMVGGGTVISGTIPSDFGVQLSRSGSPSRWSIEVINLSAFAVTISTIGFGKTDQVRHVLVKPDVSNGKQLPVRLEPREGVTFFAGFGEFLDAEIMKEPLAYAETDCGAIGYGTSPVFQQYVASLRRGRMESGIRQ